MLALFLLCLLSPLAVLAGGHCDTILCPKVTTVTQTLGQQGCSGHTSLDTYFLPYVNPGGCSGVWTLVKAPTLGTVNYIAPAQYCYKANCGVTGSDQVVWTVNNKINNRNCHLVNVTWDINLVNDVAAQQPC